MKRQSDGIPVHGKQPSFQVYPKDVEEELALLTLPAAGLWTRMFLSTHFSRNRGYLELPSGEPMNELDIAKRFGQRPATVKKLIAEMERVGTFSRDERGCIFNRRLVRDSDISRKRKRAAGKRWNTDAKNETDSEFASNLHMQNECKTDAKPMQNARARVHVTRGGSTPSFSSSSSDNPKPLFEDQAMVDLYDQFIEQYLGEIPDDLWQRFDRYVTGFTAELAANLPLWMKCRKYQHGYAPAADKFLKSGVWKKPPKAQQMGEAPQEAELPPGQHVDEIQRELEKRRRAAGG